MFEELKNNFTIVSKYCKILNYSFLQNTFNIGDSVYFTYNDDPLHPAVIESFSNNGKATIKYEDVKKTEVTKEIDLTKLNFMSVNLNKKQEENTKEKHSVDRQHESDICRLTNLKQNIFLYNELKANILKMKKLSKEESNSTNNKDLEIIKNFIIKLLEYIPSIELNFNEIKDRHNFLDWRFSITITQQILDFIEEYENNIPASPLHNIDFINKWNNAAFIRIIH